jgi:hypothetical protein
MVNSVFKDDVKKHMDKTSISSELPPGSPRRFEPTEGVNNLNKRIHKESAYADKYKQLPFEFSKPKKAKRQVIKLCGNCEAPISVSTTCVGAICRKCNTYAKVIEVESYE